MPEVPVTKRYPMFSSVLVAKNIDSSNLPASVDVTPGEGTIIMIDVISEVVDLAR